MRALGPCSAAAVLLSLVCLCLTIEAHAICNPGERQFIYVGDTATDAQCNVDTIQDAIDAVVCPNTWVVLTGEHTYTEQHLTVNTSVTLAGGAVACGNGGPPVCDPTIGCGSGGAPAQTIISGSSGNSVIHVESGGYVFLYNLYITDGDAGSDGSGGGIYFTGSGGGLTLNNTTVANNEAGYGGGIDMSPTGPATLTLQQYSLVISNTADTSGGGIRIEGDTKMFALEANTLIGFNQALGESSNGYGGGIEVLGPATAYIGSSGYGVGGVIANNLAGYGGGIAALAGDSLAVVSLFSTDPDKPVSVSDNAASQTGGGIYLEPNASIAELCAQDFVIDRNQALDGAAIFAAAWDSDRAGSLPGAVVALNTSPSSYSCDEPEPPAALGAVACSAGVPCNEIVGNVNADTSGHPAIGSSIVIGVSGQGFLHRFSARQNQNTHLLNVVEPSSDLSISDHVELRNSLLADNAGTAELITTSAEGSSDDFVLDSCTVANNLVGDAEYLIRMGGLTALQNSIIDQLSTFTIDFLGNPSDLTINDILSNDLSTLQGGAQLEQGAPTYVDAANGNYRLARTSLGVDYSPGEGGIDLDGHPRDIDLPDVPNQFGPRDLGAYEIQASCSVADTIFCNGFEG